MSTSAISSTSLNQQLQQYFQTRQSDLQQLGQALGSGDLTGAQTACNNIVSLGQSGPFANGNPFKINQREQDFTDIGQALQSGDLAGAQQAFSTLQTAFARAQPVDSSNSSSTSASGSGPEIVFNLGSSTPEQLTININPASGGGEQVSLSVADQGSNTQQVTLNLNSNSNEEIVLNFLGASSSTASSSSGVSSTGGLSVSA
ncbi:MAG: hypothetical protein WAM69_12290 [Candidatus Sulfotelmatobacter sp.]